MKRRLIALFAACMLLTALAAPALAYPAENLYKLGFTKSRSVYTGPGSSYYRANGNATYGGGGAQYYGSDPANEWMLIGYKTSQGLWRMGYVSPDSVSLIRPTDIYEIFYLTLEYTSAHTTKSSVITDDPLFDIHTPLAVLPEGHDVTVLCRWNNGWTYVETNVQDLGTMRGFVRPANLAEGPGYEIPETVQTADWQALYRSRLERMDLYGILDLELLDINFDRMPELLVNHGAGVYGYQYTMLSIAEGTVRENEYSSSIGGNINWDTIQLTGSNLSLYRDTLTDRLMWLNIGGYASGGTGYGFVAEMSMENGSLISTEIFSYIVPDSGSGGAAPEYYIRGSRTDFASYITEMDRYRSTHIHFTEYMPCRLEASQSDALNVFIALAQTYTGITQYQIP